MKKKEDILRPFNLYRGIVGLAILEMPSGQTWPKLSLLFATIKFGVYGCCFWYTFGFLINNHRSQFFVVTLIQRILLSSNIFVAVISTFLGFYYYKKNKRFEKKIALIDETLTFFGIDLEYDLLLYKIKVLTGIWLFGGFIFGLGSVITNCEKNTVFEGLVKAFTFDMPFIWNLIIELNFVIILLILGKKFERINALLLSVTAASLQPVDSKNQSKHSNMTCKNHFDNTDEIIDNCGKRMNIELVLKIVRQIHLDLCRMSRKVNSTYSLLMALQIITSFITLTGFGYFIYMIYMHSIITKMLSIFLMLCGCVVFNIFRNIYTVYVSVSVMAEAQKTSQIAFEIDVPKWKKNITDEIHQLSLQILQHPLSFNAAGFIIFDFHYIRRFAGAVTTYLMILLQSHVHNYYETNTYSHLNRY